VAGEPARSDVRQALDRALKFLASEGTAWKTDRKCASCHHVPMMAWGLAEARQRGLAVDEAALIDVTHWALAPDNPAGVFPAAASPPKFTLTTIWMKLGADRLASDAEIAAGLERLDTHLRETQEADGSWPVPDGRQPLLGDKQAATMLALLALAGYGHEANSATMEKARVWIAAQPTPATNQSTVLRLLLIGRGLIVSDRQAALDAVIGLARDDGGFSQAAGLASDAYMTGEALWAMAAAGVDRNHPAVRRAVAFLLARQQADGSWPMVSRPFGPENKGASDPRPIRFAGTAWATLGLLAAAER
jgi:hypothetical protein